MFSLRSQFLLKPSPNSTLKSTKFTRHNSTDAPNALRSAVHRGTHFENRSITLLEQHLSMSLRRVGGKGDGGIDMVGWWWIPYVEGGSPAHQRRRIRVIAQCKAEKKKVGPKYIRELEGVLHRFHISANPEERTDSGSVDIQESTHGSPRIAQPKHISSLGLFISESPFTKATILHAQSSSIPLLLLYLPPEDEVHTLSSTKGQLGTAIWNPALAGDQGLLGGQMGIRWERSIKGHNRPGLWWRESKLSSWIPSEA